MRSAPWASDSLVFERPRTATRLTGLDVDEQSGCTYADEPTRREAFFMTSRLRWLTLLATLGVLAVFGPAAAQTATVDVKAGSAVSPTDQASLADQYVAKMQASA